MTGCYFRRRAYRHFFGKALEAWSSWWRGVALVPLATVLFNVNLLNLVWWRFCSSARLATPWLAHPGCHGGQHAREVMLPILLLAPGGATSIAAVQAPVACSGTRWADLRGWTQLLVVYSVDRRGIAAHI